MLPAGPAIAANVQGKVGRHAGLVAPYATVTSELAPGMGRLLFSFFLGRVPPGKPTIGENTMPLTPRHAAATHVGRVRQSNEDRFYADAGAGIFVVADGMGGHAAGEVAAEIASTLIGKKLSAAADTGEMAKADAGTRAGSATHQASAELAATLEAAIAEADQRILDRARSDPACSGMGTTVTALCTRADSYVVGHVGDSRAYRLRDGRLERITRDHTLVQQEVDRGTLTDEQARTHPRSNILTRALGIAGRLEIDVYQGILEPGDRILLATDGLTTMLPDSEIAAILDSTAVAAASAEMLIDRANASGGIDNTTVIVIDLLKPAS